MSKFKLASKYKPSGDQPKAINQLVNGVNAGMKEQTLLGVTGSGKTFTMANIIAETNKPALIMSHNKTLSAQLFSEFKDFFPENAVEYFVSYYDYYQPEAYIAKKDLYIEKDAEINKNIEKYRSAATQSLLSRKDTIVIASVSCIYGLGNPEDYLSLTRHIKVGESYTREKFLIYLHDLQYERSEYDFEEGQYRVRGENIDIRDATGVGIRVEFFGEEIENIIQINPVTGERLDNLYDYKIFPAKQFVTPEDKLKSSIVKIEDDLQKEVSLFKKQKKDFEAKRLEQRTKFDIEMLKELGYCNGIENYSRYIDGRLPGTAPSTLIDYFPNDWLIFVDESHITLPQVKGMYNGDRARKESLVDHGFRLQAAKDNRPLKFEEFEKKINQAIYVSATPSEYELEHSKISASRFKEKHPEYFVS